MSPEPLSVSESPVGPVRPAPRYGLGALVGDMVRAAGDVIAGRPRRPSGVAITTPFRCGSCGGSTAHELFAEAIPESLGYHVVRCDDCGLVVTDPKPPSERIADFYGDVYYGPENAKFGPLTEIFIYLFRKARLRALRLQGIESGAVLDIGCGRGLFLHLLERVGYTVWGTELSEESARAGRAVCGDRMRVGPLVGCGFSDQQFDAITAWQVFEHLLDPLETLHECHRILRPDGILILSVPNIDSWQARWAGAAWFHLDVPRHLYHYSPQTLTAMLEAQGFHVETTSHYSLEQNPFGILQSVLHRLGRPHLGLYNLLRGPLDKQVRHRWIRLPGYAGYLLSFPVAMVVATMWSMLGSGATFAVVARRTDRPTAQPDGSARAA